MDTLEAIAKALRVELKDFFEFAHQKKSSQELTKEIISLLKEAEEDKLRLVLKIVRSIVR